MESQLCNLTNQIEDEDKEITDRITIFDKNKEGMKAKGCINTNKELESHLYKWKNIIDDEEKGVEDIASFVSAEISTSDDYFISDNYCVDVEEHDDDDYIMYLVKILE